MISRDSITRVCAAVAAAALVGCAAPEPMLVKQGVTYLQYQRDTVSCATAATQTIPSNTQLGWQPYVGFYTADTNNQVRLANMNLCLMEKGYSEAVIPPCPTDIALRMQAEPQATDPAKRMIIKPGSCYFYDRQMRKGLYTPD